MSTKRHYIVIKENLLAEKTRLREEPSNKPINQRNMPKVNKEPWLLVSSLPITTHSAKKIVKIYSVRMQIEEGFRDLKSTKYGFGFEHVNTHHIYRLNIFFLIAMLAAFLAWIVGWSAEKSNLQEQYQANSVKNTRILSLFYLG